MRLLRTVLLTAVIAGTIFGPTAQAHADYLLKCNRVRHDANDTKSMVRVNHGSDADTYVRGFARAEPAQYWCTNAGPEPDHRVKDIWIGTYVDYVTDTGGYYQCRKNVRGWRGSPQPAGEWWVATVDAAALRNYCFWDRKTIRGRALAKGQYLDGHVKSVWVYSGLHARI